MKVDALLILALRNFIKFPFMISRKSFRIRIKSV